MTVPAETATAPARARPGRIPDFFIVGHMKSGTTALNDALKRHPQIFMSRNKEPWFLASELSGRDVPRPRKQAKTPASLEDYMRLFKPAQPWQLAGEASAVYLWSRTAAARIAELQPGARIIAILREPVSYLRSLHFQFVQNYIEPQKDLRKALALEDARREGRQLPRNTYWPDATLYSEHVRYVEQLRRYHALFPPEQVLVLIYDDFRADNTGTLRRVLRFLNVDETVPVRPLHLNPTVRVRSSRLYGLAHAMSAGEGAVARSVRAAVGRLAPRVLTGEAALAFRDRLLYADPKPPDERLETELRRRFTGEVVALSEYLGRDLVALWGYDDIH